MDHTRSDQEIVNTTHNTSRFFVENRQVAWVLLVISLLWGAYGYWQMPKRKDPDIPVLMAVAICAWPGASADRIERLVTRKIEERIVENPKVSRVESISRTHVSIVYVILDDRIQSSGDILDDIRLRLDGIRDLPQGAGPIEFVKDFGDTSALMLAVASPKANDIAVGLRARSIASAIAAARPAGSRPGARASLIVSFPQSMPPSVFRRQRDAVSYLLGERRLGRDMRPIEGAGFVGVDLETDLDDRGLMDAVSQAVDERLRVMEIHPDTWEPVVIRDPAQTSARLATVAGDTYSYRELDEYTDLIKRTLQNVPQVSKISRSGLLREQVTLEYSQDLLAGTQQRLTDILAARNITLPGGVLEVQGKNLAIDPSGEFKAEREIGDVIVGTSASGRPAYLRDSVEITRGYETPRFLNFFMHKDPHGQWSRSRAITLGVQMRPGEQIGAFAAAVDAALATLKGRVPEDLVVSRVSDQPQQVRESVDLFMMSLYEAVVLVIVVAFVGFWEWRSAAVIALSIPLTLALTFGGMHLLNIDIQQVSLASLIIALGLLVDDPVVAGDAIKRELDAGHPRRIAAWLGPTKLATAILFATITNIVAYLPLLFVKGDTGTFLYSLPIVLTVSLVMSRIVSMSFIPMLGHDLLRPRRKPAPSREVQRTHGFTGWYSRVAGWAVDHRWLALGAAALLLALGVLGTRGLKPQFFPKDLQYLSYVDVWLPDDATFTSTIDAVKQVEQAIQQVTAKYGADHPGPDGKPRDVLESLTTFIGGGGPRFWFSAAPELFQLNYAQVIVRLAEKHDTARLAPLLQHALAGSVPGARVDVRELETGAPVGTPVAIRVSGGDIPTLRAIGDKLKGILRSDPKAARVREDWGPESFELRMQVDADRANFAGVTNQDVALSSAIGINGYQVTTLREGDKEIPVVARLRPEERARIADIRNLYVYSATGPQRVPLGQVSSLTYGMKNEKIRRRNQFRTITASAFPVDGVLPSEIMGRIRPQLTEFSRTLPPGYRMEIGGEEEAQIKGFDQLSIVLVISVVAIFLALVFQFRSAVKPIIVFSAIPFGVVGSLASLAALGVPFGFMAFLGVVSLIGVIVSHVIVLFDFIEEAHAHGEPLRDALIDAGIVRLRPVIITVGATVLGLVPLALHGGPLWEPLCYAQIGGLTVATFVTLLLVPVLYAIFVMDLKIVKWETVEPAR